MNKTIPGGMVFKAADALCREWNLYYPDAVRMAAVVLSVGQHRQPAETSNARSEWPARYMANGPQGTFYTDDLKLADALLRAYDEDDDWTVTEMPDPAGTPAVQQPPSASVEDDPIDANSNAEYIEHCADVLEQRGLRVTAGALRVIAQEHRTLSQQHAAERADVCKLVALAEQWEHDAAGCRRDGYIDAAVVKEDCAYRIRQTLGISAIAEAVGVGAPGSRAWMAEVCRAAALSLAAHGVRNDQLSKVADWIAQQTASGVMDAGYSYGLQFIDDHPQLG